MENQKKAYIATYSDDCVDAYMGKIKEVIFNEPATIVFWNDGTKTVVKTSPNDKFDKEKGILWAYFLKHASGTKTNVYQNFIEDYNNLCDNKK